MTSVHFEMRISPKQLLKKWDISGSKLPPGTNTLALRELKIKIILLFKKIVRQYACERYVCCLEKLSTRDGSDLSLIDKQHYHFRFETAEPKKISAIQKWIKSNASFTLAKTGNCCFCIKAYPDIDDDDRWWRYPFKENYLKGLTHGFSKTEIANYVLLAADEHKRAIKANQERAAIKLRRNTLYDRIAKYLDKTFIIDASTDGFSSMMPIWILILEYYLKEGVEINPISITAKTRRYQLEKKIISNILYFKEVVHVNK